MNKMFKSKQKVENFTEQQISEGHLSLVIFLFKILCELEALTFVLLDSKNRNRSGKVIAANAKSWFFETTL